MTARIFATLLSVALFASAAPAFAYVGPGAGLSLIGAFWALILAVFTAVFFLLAWPMRRLLRNSRARNRGTGSAPPRDDDRNDGSLAI